MSSSPPPFYLPPVPSFLRVVVGIIGAASAILAAVLLWILAAEIGARDYTILGGVALLGLFTVGCWLTASGRSNALPFGSLGRSPRARVAWTVFYVGATLWQVWSGFNETRTVTGWAGFGLLTAMLAVGLVAAIGDRPPVAAHR